MVPAYLAFPLYGGEHLPSGTPTLSTGPQGSGATVGPLNLNPLIQSELNAALETSQVAVVETPNRNYAVTFLPHYARTHSPSAASSSSSGGGNASQSSQAATTITSASTSNSTARSTPALDPTIQGIPLSELERWAKQGSSKLVHWTTIGANDLAKSLGIGGPKAAPRKLSSHLAAQTLAPPLGEESSSSATLPAPVPEPSTWLVFGLILGAAGLRRWVGRST
jgi:hypothetical protein